MSFDATQLEIDRRAHAYEMGADSNADRAWSRFYDAAQREIVARGWDEKFTGGAVVGKSRGLDGADAETGYSIDSAYDAWEARQSVATYIAAVGRARTELGL